MILEQWSFQLTKILLQFSKLFFSFEIQYKTLFVIR